ncbi:MAG TPA: hypothetical protein PK453_27645 [Leptospiraceae bacterium]|nr:hypothetical protein [Leptospiraceae bacterium]HNI26165.1 hypothetical protein [Leptospiraceae bacterium]HNM05047.1 hypothetical protein [Leptospiraceae bacterium]
MSHNTASISACRIQLNGGKIALKSDNGKYAARCRNCSPGAAYEDTVTVHADDPENQA